MGNFKHIICTTLLTLCTVLTISAKKDAVSEVYRGLWDVHATTEAIKEYSNEVTKKFIDSNANPCDDFYQYSCGNWANSVLENRDKKSTFGVVGATQEYVDNAIKLFLSSDDETFGEMPSNYHFEGLLTEEDIKDVQQKARGFYQKCMNTDEIQAKGSEIAKEFIKEFSKWDFKDKEDSSDEGDLSSEEDHYDFTDMTAKMGRHEIPSLIQMPINTDHLTYVFTIQNVPVFDEILKKSQSNSLNNDICKYYDEKLITDILKHSGLKHNSKMVDKIIEVEQELENLAVGYKNGIVYKVVNSTTISQPFANHLHKVLGKDIPVEHEIFVENIVYLPKLKKFLDGLSKEDLKTSLKFRLALFVAKYTSDLVTNNFDSHEERINFCVSETREHFRFSVDALYMGIYFSDAIKSEIKQIVSEIQEIFRASIMNNSWVAPKTKELILDKIDRSSVKIGIANQEAFTTDIKEDLAAFELNADNFLEMVLTMRKQVFERKLKHDLQSTDKEEPTIVNAFFNPFANSTLIIPAAILSPNYFHIALSRFSKYGGIGSVLGHELIHGYDVRNVFRSTEYEVIKIDPNTVLEYFQRALCLSRQYSKYQYSNKNVDGFSTLSDNLADNAGLKFAFKAYQNWLNSNENRLSEETIPGLDLNPSQLFFVKYAQNWCQAIDENSESGDAAHSPDKFRIIGSVTNSDDFAHVFNCSANSPMNPTKKCQFF